MSIKAKTKYTPELMLKFSKFNTIKSPFYVAFYIIMEFVMLAVGLLFIITSKNTLELIISVGIITPIVLLLIPLILKFIPALSVKMSRNLLDCINTYEFTDEEIVVHSTLPVYGGNSKFNYNFLESVYETRDAFYLFISKQQAFIINKTDIVEGNAKELQKLLKKNIHSKKYFIKSKCSKTVPVLATIMIAIIILATVYAYKNPYSNDYEEKVFSNSGLTITLTDGFNEKEHASYTAVYDSENIAIFTLKEEFSLFDHMELSLDEYAELIIQTNNIDAEIKEVDGLTTFSYVKNSNGKEYKYFATVYEGSDAFWLVQFACENAKYDDLESTILQYAKSVVLQTTDL